MGSNIFLDEYDSLKFVWCVVIVIIIICVLVTICITLDRLSCERSGEQIADGYHFGWLEGCYYKIDGIMVSRHNYNELYQNQEITIKGELKLDGR